MKKETLEKLIDAIGVKLEELQNTIVAKSQIWLNYGIVRSTSVEMWANKQRQSINQLKAQLQEIANSFIGGIKDELKDTYQKELTLVDSDFKKNLDEEIEIPKDVEDKINKLTESVKEQTKSLVDEVAKLHNNDVTKVVYLAAISISKKQQANKSLGTAKKFTDKEIRLQRTQAIYDSIVKATESGIENQPKVLLRDGRQMNWKSYMELQSRTVLKQEASEYQNRSAEQLGVIFWALSSHSDCADDHKAFQGRFFISRNWQSKVQDEELKEKIQNYIRSHHILFKEDVTEEGRLLKRPIEMWNCRHYFEPVTIEQVLNCKNSNQREKLLDKLQMNGGAYSKRDYDDTQKQRYNERKIRQFKAQLQKDIDQYKSAPKDVDTSVIEKHIERDKERIRFWQLRQRELMKKNSNLNRDWRRETNTVVKDDLGARYNNKPKK